MVKWSIGLTSETFSKTHVTRNDNRVAIRVNTTSHLTIILSNTIVTFINQAECKSRNSISLFRQGMN